MYLEFEADYRKTWISYGLTDVTGRLFHVGCVLFVHLTSLSDVPPMTLPDGGTVYLSIIDRDLDRLKLLNRTVKWLDNKKRDDLIRNLKTNIPLSIKRYVICNETGETFKSIRSASIMHNLSESSLYKHIKGMVGYKTVKGRTYTVIGEQDE